jgi:hypothetical protein
MMHLSNTTNNITQSSEIDPRNLPAGTTAYIYARVSPGDNQTIESQLEELRSYCQERAWIIANEFHDSMN